MTKTYEMVETVTVYSEKDAKFIFKDGSEISISLIKNKKESRGLGWNTIPAGFFVSME